MPNRAELSSLGLTQVNETCAQVNAWAKHLGWPVKRILGHTGKCKPLSPPPPYTCTPTPTPGGALIVQNH